MKDTMLLQQITTMMLTDSNKDDVTTAFVNPPVLMFARTGAPNPIEESCRLFHSKKSDHPQNLC